MIKCVTLETAKKIKEAGFPQSTYFYYIGERKFSEKVDKFLLGKDQRERGIAAPIAEEVLDELPVYVQFEKHSLPFVFRVVKELGGDFPDEYVVYYSRQRRIITEKDDYQERGRSTNESLAEAAAKMYLFLKKEGLI